MMKVVTGPKVHISSVNDTITCLHQMCDYWDFKVNPERQQKITGSKLIDSAIHGLFPGDLICTISEFNRYGDAIARALAISGNKAGKDLLVIGFPHYIRDFWCEILARESGFNPLQVVSANFNDSEWERLNDVFKELKLSTSIYCSRIASFEHSYLERKIREAKSLYPDIQVILLGGVNTNDLPQHILNEPFGDWLKHIAIDTGVSMIVSISDDYVCDSSISSIEQQLPREWEIPVFADAMLFCNEEERCDSDANGHCSNIHLYLRGRVISEHMLVPLEHACLAQLKDAHYINFRSQLFDLINHNYEFTI